MFFYCGIISTAVVVVVRVCGHKVIITGLRNVERTPELREDDLTNFGFGFVCILRISILFAYRNEVFFFNVNIFHSRVRSTDLTFTYIISTRLAFYFFPPIFLTSSVL